jgi:hypothetical protein
MMTKYGCGHYSKPIIMDNNPLSFLAWEDWKDTDGWNGTKKLCFDRWCDKNPGWADKK